METKQNKFYFQPEENLYKFKKKNKNYFRDELEMRTIKIIDIGYITILYFILGIMFSLIFDKIFGKWDKKRDEKKSLTLIGIELILIIWVYGSIVYIVRNFVEIIPSPLSYVKFSNPKKKFFHHKVKELSSATVFTLVFFSRSDYFTKKFGYFYQRLSDENI